MHDDKSRLQKVLELLPEWFIREFLGYYLHNIYFHYAYLERLERFDVEKDEIMLEFSNPKVREKFETLKSKFDSLDAFLSQHFSIPRIHYKAYENPPYLYLEPRLHHNFYHSEGEQSEYTDEARNEFEGLCDKLKSLKNEFWDAYVGFLRVAKEANNMTKNKWWDTTWFQVSMVILAVLGLLGFGGWTFYYNNVRTDIQGDVISGDKYNQDVDTVNNFFTPTSTNLDE